MNKSVKSSISIILTIYNTEQCLPDCLDSLLRQSFTAFKLICIDDGSTDGSAAVLQKYAEKDSRLVIVHTENRGPAEARNLGLEMAQEDYVMMLDSDDIFSEVFLEHMMAEAEAKNADVVVCRSCEWDHVTHAKNPSDWTLKTSLLPNERPFSPEDTKGCLFAAFIGWPWDKLYRTSFLRKEELQFPLLDNSEDFLFVYSCLLKARAISVVDEVLVKHRVNRAGSVSNSRLMNPLCFYNGIEQLKNLMDSEGFLSRDEYKWGLLNWALDYTLWNIGSFPCGSTREQLIRRLFDGDFPVLELESHALQYYSLYQDVPERLFALMKEHEQAGGSELGAVYETVKQYFVDTEKRQGNGRRSWGYLAKYCEAAGRLGFIGATRKAIRHLVRGR